MSFGAPFLVEKAVSRGGARGRARWRAPRATVSTSVGPRHCRKSSESTLGRGTSLAPPTVIHPPDFCSAALYMQVNEYGEYISPSSAEVLEYGCPTDTYCCPLSANRYGIAFEMFRVRDHETGQILFDVQADPGQEKFDLTQIPPGHPQEDAVRCISYDFGADFLSLPTIGTELLFSVGPEPLHSFRMIERHYFRDFLIKSFDFTFGFCIPNSTNSWEAIYDVPELPPELVEDMINNPWETQSDSFYFVTDAGGNEEMVMHNKAKYAYSLSPP